MIKRNSLVPDASTFLQTILSPAAYLEKGAICTLKADTEHRKVTDLLSRNWNPKFQKEEDKLEPKVNLNKEDFIKVMLKVRNFKQYKALV
jgi:hypothetical protein